MWFWYNDGGDIVAAYKCFFDGSHTKEMSASAFFVETEGQMIHSHVYHERFESASKAEKFALYLLLQYINTHIEPGRTVAIYGDDKSLIETLDRRSGKRRRTKIYKLFRYLRSHYDLTLQFIPGKENRTAHKLSKQKYVAPVKQLNESKATKLNGYTISHRTTILLDDITVPYRLLYSTPNHIKYQSRLLFYQQHGHVYKTIQVDSDGMMLDGYISYLILKDHGIHECDVEVMEQIIATTA